MPTPKQAMYAALNAAPAVTAVVGQAIFPDQALSNVEPYLEFSQVSHFQRKGLRGPVGSIRARFEIKAFCTTRAQADSLQNALKALFDGTSGSMGGLQVNGSFVGVGDEDEGAVDDDEPPRPGEESGLRDVRMDVFWVIAP